MLLAHALVHYIHDGHPYQLAMRSANAISWIEHGQYVMLERLDLSEEFWRIRDELAKRYGALRRRGAVAGADAVTRSALLLKHLPWQG